MLNPLCLNSRDLLSLLGRDVKVLRSGNFGGWGREEDLDVTWVTLVWVAAVYQLLSPTSRVQS